MYNTIILDYLNNFKCLKSNCIDNCCINWSINIDKETYSMYESLNDLNIKNFLLPKIYTDENGNHSMKMCDDGKCQFLNSEKLC